MYTLSKWFLENTALEICLIVYIKNPPTFVTSALFLGEEPICFFFLFRGDRRVSYNAGNTAGFSNVAQENFKVGCPS